MPTYVAMLRGVNVSGRNKIAMADLRSLVSALGHRRVTTYVQSGNVVFDTRSKDVVEVSQGLERAITQELGLSVAVLIRTADERPACPPRVPS